jgi:hypothetical protein
MPPAKSSTPPQTLQKMCDQLLSREAGPSNDETVRGGALRLSQLTMFSQREDSQSEPPAFSIAYEREAIESCLGPTDGRDPLQTLFASQFSQTVNSQGG